MYCSWLCFGKHTTLGAGAAQLRVPRASLQVGCSTVFQKLLEAHPYFTERKGFERGWVGRGCQLSAFASALGRATVP